VTDEIGPAQLSGIGRRRAAALDEGRTAYSERRQEIVAAAAQLFKSHGFRGTSLGQIADALNTDRATLYYYVGSKEELFDEVVSDAVRANVARAEAIRDGDGTAPEKLRRLITELMESYAASYPFLYVFIQEDLAHVSEHRSVWSQEMRALNKAYEGCVVAMVEGGIAEGTIRPIAEPWVLAYGLIGMVGWTNRWFNPAKSEVDATTIGRAYADLVLDGLSVRP
jgi:TetR/AcrR family transcriptional regulator, cholesterol catabolism regulator